MALEPGGQGANLAVRLARRGVSVRLITALGDDHAGAMLRDALATDGVDVRSVSATSTGMVVVLRGGAGERTMLSQRPTYAAAASEVLPRGAAWLVFSGYCLLEPGADALVRKAAASTARRALIGCAVPEPLLTRWRELATSLRPDLLVLNEDEAAALGPLAGEGAVAVTDARGARLTIGGATHRAAVRAGPPAIDTTGAGDAFAASLLAAILGHRWPPDRPGEALATAVEAAASVARVQGAQARVPGERDATLPA
jgi:sugar/nucleoside kinase (ribokinase family)